MNIPENPFARIAAALPPEELRQQFLVTGLFQPGELKLRWWETDRTIVGGIVPTGAPLALSNPAELRATFFLERREAGVLNLGGTGIIRVDGTEYPLSKCDALYLGRGAKEVVFSSASAADPARFYLLSYSAHTAYPTKLVPFATMTPTKLGSRENANERTIYKAIHAAAVDTCQVVMGFTRMETGSVWNTMPPHTHSRRSEVYLYFDLPADQAVFHFMGQPQATRHLVMRNFDVVLSPPWSIHCGVGTAAYTFVWGMGGENRDYADMDPAPLASLR
ncbi:MAG TPA: 5-dehydro-4-deoxy-D-glucuronate isomerase [Opitutaceae bacterium]|nr:5-dehydro-4-deoxy-D-glucuronate isomerase [Opitutaceae bacterium]